MNFKKLMLLGSMLCSSVFANSSKPVDHILLTKDNTIILDEEISSETVAQVSVKAQELDSKLGSKDPLYLVLYTPGGSIQAGLELITFLQGLNRPVHTITQFAASMGFQTVQGLGTRYITHFGTLMAHKAYGSFRGEFPGQIDSRYVYYVKRLNELDRITAKRSKGKLSAKKLQDLYENEYWVDGFDAVKIGLADKVVNIKCDHSLNGTRTVDVESFFGSVRLYLSECPMIMGPVGVEAMIHTDKGLLSLKDFMTKGGKFKKSGSYESSYTYTENPTLKEVLAPVSMLEDLTVDIINSEVAKVREARKLKPKVVKANQ